MLHSYRTPMYRIVCDNSKCRRIEDDENIRRLVLWANFLGWVQRKKGGHLCPRCAAKLKDKTPLRMKDVTFRV